MQENTQNHPNTAPSSKYKKKTNLAIEKTKGVLLLLSASMGIGCLGIPSSIAQVGFLPWVGIILSVAAFYFLSYYVIMRLCDHFNATTVSQLGARMLNEYSFIIDFLYVVVNLAGYLACIITLNEDMPIIAGLFPHNVVVDYLRESPYIWIYISTIVTSLILMYIPVKKLHSVTFISALSSICLICFISFGLLYRTNPIHYSNALTTTNWKNKYSVFMFLGFAFLCQQNLMTLRQASNITEFKDVMSTVRIFTVCILGIYGLIGFMGYLTFYDDPRLAHSNVLALYLRRDFFYSLMMILINMNIQVGNAVMLYPIRDIIMEYIYGPKPISHKNSSNPADLTQINSPKSNKQLSVFFRNNKQEKTLNVALVKPSEVTVEMTENLDKTKPEHKQSGILIYSTTHKIKNLYKPY
jgi:amino acid permease